MVDICQAWADVYRDVQEELIIACVDCMRGVSERGAESCAACEWMLSWASRRSMVVIVGGKPEPDVH